MKILKIPSGGSGGIDTSDATAVASDIVKNKTAYVNGEKIKGTVEELVYGITPPSFTLAELIESDGGKGISAKYSFADDYLVRSGAEVSLNIKPNQLGDATPADVVAGKTFTSSSGRLITGTATGGGKPLFDDEYLIDTGTEKINLSTQGACSIAGEVTFDMSKVQIFFFWVDLSEIEKSKNIDTLKNKVMYGHALYIPSIDNNGSTFDVRYYAYQYLNSNISPTLRPSYGGAINVSDNGFSYYQYSSETLLTNRIHWMRIQHK